MELTTTTATELLRFHIPLLHSHLSLSSLKPRLLASTNKLKGSRFRLSSRKSIPTVRSLADETQFSDSGRNVAVADPSLAVKKKAMDIAPDLKGTSIFLVGMNNPLKSSLGKVLADVLRYYYFDCDSLVEEAAGGESDAKAYRETDEKGFRESETEVLKQLSSMGRLVVCAGDGAVQSSTNLALLRHGISIWIDVPLEIVARGSHSEAFAQLAARYEKLRDGYSIADATISLRNIACQLGHDDLDAVTTEDMAMEVLEAIEKLTRVKKMIEAAARPF
ncbi:probable inactive shikimate kinase like 1, chloroplastic isoform X2 [Carica papaya]|uniref:probable inactive shikimate kinase like 1, chloroplastic isoform X2 n=1 Tax=Carica papaya TaxID=3649 RepID=UPI000B8C899D|nr:probable inactive shikimate kinase like 1, chloroplastic isoform X2 [Carica papaya]